MIVEQLEDNKPIICAMQNDEPALKQWIFDMGCTDQLNPNLLQFISYTPFKTPCSICLGNLTLTPSLGMGTVELNCIVNGASVKHLVKDVQYVPRIIYGLLARKCLNRKGLSIVVEGGAARLLTPVGLSLQKPYPPLGSCISLTSHPIQ